MRVRRARNTPPAPLATVAPSSKGDQVAPCKSCKLNDMRVLIFRCLCRKNIRRMISENNVGSRLALTLSLLSSLLSYIDEGREQGQYCTAHQEAPIAHCTVLALAPSRMRVCVRLKQRKNYKNDHTATGTAREILPSQSTFPDCFRNAA